MKRTENRFNVISNETGSIVGQVNAVNEKYTIEKVYDEIFSAREQGRENSFGIGDNDSFEVERA